ncbi:UDP-N-acetylglucosamine 2-epimerase (non-hydrolyzing) [Candidatus Kaiserbacteria bacterium]|nr:UDP-N-acetylglucosamine 2-epimerase (non-hydrolyzing) [Candidatus Kaiserbacteria bacterium]
MPTKTKVLTILGTRPEIIRLSAVIKELDARVEHVLVHTGQNYDYELNEIFFKDLGLRKPDHFLEAAGTTAIETIANLLVKTDEILEKEKPDAVLVLGDTNSALAIYAAKRRKTPIFHMEAGNRCFDERVPEEINRRIVDHTSDINLVYSERAREYLLREGFPPDRIIKTGSPMFEVLTAHADQIKSSGVMKKLGLARGTYFVASFHREENVGTERGALRIKEILDRLAATYTLPIILSLHPRTKKVFEERHIVLPKLVQAQKPLGFFDYVALETNAACVLSDSGTINEESSILGFPAVNVREAHERPEASDEGITVLAGLNPDRVLEAVALAIAYAKEGKKARLVADYSMPNVSQKVVQTILGYVGYVKRRIWFEGI